MNPIDIATLMQSSGVGFGTSGARGLVNEMTDRVCYAYTVAFIQHLEGTGDITRKTDIAIAGDLRASSERIMNAVAKAVLDRGHRPINCGRIPSPAVACFGIEEGIPSIMVTGSHIPDDRNGIKYNKPTGEILKPDEAGIRAQKVAIPDGLFDTDERFAQQQTYLPEESGEPFERYITRYLEFFPAGALAGVRVGLYEHSAVTRECLLRILQGLGAEVIRLGRSEKFIPVDTEAIRDEDVRLARQWSEEHRLDAIVSSDGDGDRPLVGDEKGCWLRGDIAGIICALSLGADIVVTPVSSNSAVDLCGQFNQVRRTRIGSPYVIAEMEGALGGGTVVGYEANGGFLTATNIELNGRPLRALPTRDAALVILTILHRAKSQGLKLSALSTELPQRFTASGRLKAFPTETSRAILTEMQSGDPERDRLAIEQRLGNQFGQAATLDCTDGLRIGFKSGEIVHLRPSGNAPEFRCYNEADSEERAEEMNRICLELMAGWRENV